MSNYFISVVRNPDFEWRKNYLKNIPKEQTAFHLCGGEAFWNILADNFEKSSQYEELKQVNRVQLNINARHRIFSVEEIHGVYDKLLGLGMNIIVQFNDNSKEWIVPYVQKSKNLQNIDILLDSSLGRGILRENFEVPEVLKFYFFKYGLAGGVNIENIKRVRQQGDNLGAPYWVDLESGARTNNEFDFGKGDILAESMR